MLRVLPENQREDRCATSDRIMLPDGSVLTVPRANLAAAKSALAARKAAERRVDAARIASPRERAIQRRVS